VCGVCGLVCDAKHTTWRIKIGEVFQRGRNLHTTRSIAQMFVGVLAFNVSSICMIVVADRIACRLHFFMSAPVIPRLWSGFLVWLL